MLSLKEVRSLCLIYLSAFKNKFPCTEFMEVWKVNSPWRAYWRLLYTYHLFFFFFLHISSNKPLASVSGSNTNDETDSNLHLLHKKERRWLRTLCDLYLTQNYICCVFSSTWLPRKQVAVLHKKGTLVPFEISNSTSMLSCCILNQTISVFPP